jgi:TolB protein
MDTALIESKYADLKQAFEEGRIDAEEFQVAVDDLRAQDEYGRYWIIGAETGAWYYYDGVEWVQADPNEANSLPFVDEEGVYWMLGKETNEWYYFDGEAWVKPQQEAQEAEPEPAQPSTAQTQYYQDDEGRYWAKGSKTGQWYYYDETGWHQADELPQAQPFQPAPSYQPDYGQPTAQPPYTQSAPFQPVQPPPSYLHSQTPTQAAQDFSPSGEAQPSYVEPSTRPQQPVADPSDQAQPAVFQEQPQQPTADPTGYTQPIPPQQPQPQPQPRPQQPPSHPSPSEAQLEPGVWYYFDGEQWLSYQDSPDAQVEEETLPDEEQLEPGVWYYFDGEQWLRYQGEPDTEAGLEETPDEVEAFEDEEEYFDEDEYLEDEEALFDEDEIIRIDDLEDFIEVIEVDEEDIIDSEEELIDAEFQVEVLPPKAETVASASPVESVVTPTPVPEAKEQTAPQPAVQPEIQAEQTKPVHAETAPPQPKMGPVPRPAAEVQRTSPGLFLRALPLWIWTSLGGFVTLIFAALLIIGVLYLLNNREKAVAIIESQLTPTLPAIAPPTTPTPASTPMPTATAPPTPTSVPLSNFASNYFGFSMDYPSGWVNKEDDDLVIFAPSARALDRTSFNGASLRISLAADAKLTELLTSGLEEFSPISETLNEGIMNIGRQSWASAQIRFDSEDMGTEAIALVASTVTNGAGYTLIAVAPASEWEDYKPLFQYTIDSFQFLEQTTAAAPSETEKATRVADATSEEPTATATATVTPTAITREPLIYEVQAGDTLGGIALKFDVSVDDLVKANGFADKSVIIRVGQELIIPQPGVEIAAATATSAPTPTSTPKSTPTPTSKVTATTPVATPSEIATTTVTTTTEALEPTKEPTTTLTPTSAPTSAPTSTPAPEITLSGRIVYPAYSTDITSFNIWSTNVDGSDPLIIAGNASQPQYSQNGALLAYRSWKPNERGIYFIDFAGGRQGLLTMFIEDALPSWYSDGTLVFTSRREGDRVPRLFKVDQRGGGGYSLGFNSDYADTLPDNRLVARGCTLSGDCGLWMLLPDGSGEVKISGNTSDSAPAAHPQGGRIAIMSFDRDGAQNWEIWTINEDGSDPVRLTNNGANDGLPTWSPDGQSIAFVSDREGVWAIWAMNADGSNQRKLFNMQGPPDGQVLHDVPNSKGWLEERIDWIP